jgi:hypothetical protein
VTGIVAAAWCVGIGLAVLTTVTLIGWIAAPRTALGPGLPGVFRTAVNFWLVAHHAGFSVKGGRVGLLPLGPVVLPGALLYRSGGWIIRVTEVRGRRRIGVMQVAMALAGPYAILAGLLALTARSAMVTPSAWQALLAGFLLALFAGGLGAARAIVTARGKRVRSGLGALLRLLPDRPRSLVVGVVGATAVLMSSGAVLAGISLAMDMSDAKASYDALAPGIIGGFLLLLVELAFLPNMMIWGMAYAIGPGFSVGAGTSVSPTGVFINSIPLFPPLAALPEPGPAPAISLFALAVPFVAGVVGGVLTIRAMPSPVYEAAPLWGFVSGALTGCVAAVLSVLSSGPLGGGRLAIMGPSAWQVGLLAALEVGVSAAIAAWVTNWTLLRRADGAPGPDRPGGGAGERAARPGSDKPPQRGEPAADHGAGESDRPTVSGRPARGGDTGELGKAAEKEARSPAEESGIPPKGRRAVKRAKDGRKTPRPEAPAEPSAAPGSPPVQFVDPEPILAVRKSSAPRDGHVPGSRQDPATGGTGRDDAAAESGDGDGDGRKVENRGGAIYVLKNDPTDRSGLTEPRGRTGPTDRRPRSPGRAASPDASGTD